MVINQIIHKEIIIKKIFIFDEFLSIAIHSLYMSKARGYNAFGAPYFKEYKQKIFHHKVKILLSRCNIQS